MTDLFLSYTQKLVLREACRILQVSPKGFSQGLWPLYLLGRKDSISASDLGLLATVLPSIIDRLRKATDERFLTELALKISDRNIPFDRAIELACRHLATSDG